ncbi:Protein of unknown function [Lactobacillus equicursoris DSM 19284 = JCM 14600 = CIP 110162]|nr:Protein of unknown function [Lactobacillus equicursoris DSM 19284 = JCM 14600 = CIP 110162]
MRKTGLLLDVVLAMILPIPVKINDRDYKAGFSKRIPLVKLVASIEVGSHAAQQIEDL